MDEGTLKALKTYTNLAHFFGFCPYKFCMRPKSSAVAPALPPNWYGHDYGYEIITVSSAEENGSRHGNKVQANTKSKARWLRYLNPVNLLIFRKGGKNQGSEQSQSQIGTNWYFSEGSNRGRWILIFSMGLQGAYQSFLVFRSVQSIFDKEQSTRDKIHIFYLTGILMIFDYFQYLLFSHYDEFPDYLNAVRDTTIGIKVKGRGRFENEDLSKRSIKSFIYAAMTLNIFVVLVRSLSVFKNPGSKLVVTSLAPDPKKLPIGVKILAALFHFHVSCFSSFVSGYSVVTLIWYVASVLPVLEKTKLVEEQTEKRGKQLQLQSQTQEQHKQHEVDLEFLRSSYNQLWALQNNLKTLYGYIVLGSEIASVFIVVLNIFLAVVHGETPGFLRAIVMIYLMDIFFSKLSDIHTESEEGIDSWKRSYMALRGRGRDDQHKFNQYFARFQRSAKPLRMYVGSFFYVDQAFILTLLGIVIDLTTNLILSSK